MPSGNYEVWADGEHVQSYLEKDAAVQHGRRLIENGERDVIVWDLTRTKIGSKRLQNRILDPKRVDLRPRGVHFSRGRAVNHGS